MARKQLLKRVVVTDYAETEFNKGGREVIEFMSVANRFGDAPDDRFPGSFFRIPGMPSRAASWSLS